MRRAFAALPAALLLYGCAGNGPPPSGSGSAYDTIQTQIFNQHCLSAGCHNNINQAGNLILTAGVSYGNLVGVTPNNPVAAADGLLRVQPFTPSNSFLLVKLTGQPPLGEGSQMPLGMQPLSPTDINMIQAWIADGAPPPGTPGASATPTPSPSETVAPTATDTATITPTPIDTATPTATGTGTQPPTPTPSETPTASPTETALPWLTRIQTTIFDPSCATMFCHDSATASGNLVLTEGQSYSNLVGVQPDNGVARDRGLMRVQANDLANSFLMVKVEGKPPLGEGSQMPLTGPKLTADQIALLAGWIEAGAPNNN